MNCKNLGKNFTNTVKTRPPLVVFTVCLLGIVVTSFTLAYYIHNVDKPVFNNDAKDDWLSLLKYFNTQDICIENEKERIFEKGQGGKKDLIVSTSLMAKVLKLSAHQDMNIEGLVSLNGWSSRCTERGEKPNYLHVAFSLPKKKVNSSDDAEMICITLTGPSHFMPILEENSSCGPSSDEHITKWGRLSTKLSDSENTHFCKDGFTGKLEYDLDYSRNLKWNMFLSAEDRVRIGYHLIITSFILLLICVLIFCYALTRVKASNGEDTKQSLMSKGMYL